MSPLKYVIEHKRSSIFAIFLKRRGLQSPGDVFSEQQAGPIKKYVPTCTIFLLILKLGIGIGALVVRDYYNILTFHFPHFIFSLFWAAGGSGWMGWLGSGGEATLSSRSPDRQFVSYNSFFSWLGGGGWHWRKGIHVDIVCTHCWEEVCVFLGSLISFQPQHTCTCKRELCGNTLGWFSKGNLIRNSGERGKTKFHVCYSQVFRQSLYYGAFSPVFRKGKCTAVLP